MAKRLLIGAFLLAAYFFSITVMGEDAVDADPEHYTVEFENDKVRIIRVKYGPGEKSVMHTHGPHVAVILSEGTWRMTLPDGTSAEETAPFGAAGWNDANEHLPERVSDTPGEVVLIEIKE